MPVFAFKLKLSVIKIDASKKFQIPFQLGLSKMDLRKVVKSSLAGVSKSLNLMNLASIFGHIF